MLFTTLIPVYKSQFLPDIVACLNAQNLQSFTVIFSDDSPTKDLAEVMHDLQTHEKISFPYKIVQGRNIGPVTNCYDLLDYCDHSTPYIHFLFDDDLIFPDFYQSHADAYQQTQAQACISSRIIVSEDKQPYAAPSLPPFLTASNERVSLLKIADVAHSILPSCNNWLGEMSSATFNGQVMRQTLKGALQNIPYYGLNDLGVFLEILAQHPVAYIYNNLGAFRRNRSQTSQDRHSKVFQSTIISWASLILDAHSKSWLSDAQTQQGLKKAKEMIQATIQANHGYEELASSLASFDQPEIAKQLFNAAWRSILEKNPDAIRHLIAPPQSSSLNVT